MTLYFKGMPLVYKESPESNMLGTHWYYQKGVSLVPVAFYNADSTQFNENDPERLAQFPGVTR